MQKPLISIIVPVYNAEDFVERCLFSIQEQTYKKIEVVIVDDGSTDNSNQICRKFIAVDRRFKLYTQENGGRSAARNRGLSLASGELVGFVDSDDWVEKDMFETLYSAHVKWNADVVQCSYYYHCGNRVDDKSRGEKDRLLNREQALELLFRDKEIKNFLCNKLFNRSLFFDISFPLKKNFEDLAVMYRLFAKCQVVVCLPIAKYHYLVSHTSVSHAVFSVKDKFDYLDALNSQYNYAKSVGLWKKSSVLLARKYLSILDECLIHKVDPSYIMKLAGFLEGNVNGLRLLKQAPYLALRRFLFLHCGRFYFCLTKWLKNEK